MHPFNLFLHDVKFKGVFFSENRDLLSINKSKMSDYISLSLKNSSSIHCLKYFPLYFERTLGLEVVFQ